MTRRRLKAKATQQRKGRIASDADVKGQLARLRQTLDRTVAELHLTPNAVERVVATALALGHQEPLKPAPEVDDGVFHVGALTGSWARTADGLAHPMRPEELRPITFDARVAGEHREDVVLAHLNHRLVAMSTHLLRASANSSDSRLHRVAAVISDDPRLESMLVAAYARFLIVGGDGLRLHEEVLHAGGWVRDGRFARLENLGLIDSLLSTALDAANPVPPHLHPRLADGWEKVKPGLIGALNWRRDERLKSLTAQLKKRQEDEQFRYTANIDRFEASLRQRIAESERDETDFGQLMLDITDADEKAQLRRDQSSWRARLDRLAGEREAQLDRISARFESQQSHLFPVCVVYVVPRREVTR
jgi:hypothetical protein